MLLVQAVKHSYFGLFQPFESIRGEPFSFVDVAKEPSARSQCREHCFLYEAKTLWQEFKGLFFNDICSRIYKPARLGSFRWLFHELNYFFPFYARYPKA